MKKIKAVIFDIDGTVANTIPIIIQAYRQAVEPLVHRPLSDDEIVATFGPLEEGSIRAIAPEDYKKGTADFLRIYKELHDMCPHPFDGITELLNTLKSKGVKVALSTGKGKESTDISLQRFNLHGFFDIIETGSPEGSRKIEAMKYFTRFRILQSGYMQKYNGIMSLSDETKANTPHDVVKLLVDALG